MDEREALLRGIFLDPSASLPKLVFADYLEERDEEVWAHFLRLSCELHSRKDMLERATLRGTMFNYAQEHGLEMGDSFTGFRECDQITVTAQQLLDSENFRRQSVYEHPEWFGARELKVTSGPLTTRECLVTIMTAPATQNVTHLDLSGQILEAPTTEGETTFYDMQQHPLITSKMVENLVGMRECRRLVRLDLRNNSLGNDAVRAVARSPHLHRLKFLFLKEGNDFKGQTWQEIQERFGEDIPY
jgi:uncharacterized protein (TIGR02996 family)